MNWRCGGRLVSLSVALPLGYTISVTHFGSWPFPSSLSTLHTTSLIKIVQMDLNCGLSVAFLGKLWRRRLAGKSVGSLFVDGKCQCLPNETTRSCFSWKQALYISCKSVQFFFSSGRRTLPLTHPWNTIPLCHLHKLVFFHWYMSPVPGIVAVREACFRTLYRGRWIFLATIGKGPSESSASHQQSVNSPLW